MKWISVKERLPDKYDTYLIYCKPKCEECLDPNEKNDQHRHPLNYKYFRYDLASWNEKDMHLVNWYQNKGDHSWDWASQDHWTDCDFFSEEITHWQYLPEPPKDDK